MELRHLRYFVAVADELNFRKAAERLHVTRPALSKQVKDLEEETGLRLLIRDTVRVSLTDAGSVFLAEARAILSDVDRAVELAREAQAGRRGHLRIGSVGQIAASFLPEALKAFGATYPEVEVTFVEMTPIEQLAALAKGDIHIGFAYGSTGDDTPGFGHLLLVRSTYGVSVSRHHSFARRKSVRLGELTKSTLLCLGDKGASTHRRDICRIFEEEDVVPGSMRHVSGFDSLLTMIAADQGVSLIPVILDLSKSHGIITVPLELTVNSGSFSMWAVWREDGGSLLIKNFIRILEAHRGDLAG